MISILSKVSCHNRLQILSMLPVTSASYSRILHWFIHVVDNCSVKDQPYMQRITVSANRYG